MSSYVHVLDGRVRIKVPAVKHDPCMASAVVQVLERVAGVTYVRANTNTGNVLVLFSPQVTNHEQISQILSNMDCLTPPSPPPSSASPSTPFSSAPSFQEVGEKLLHFVVKSAVEKAVERVILSLI
jgi:Heavy metal associated domain 2